MLLLEKMRAPRVVGSHVRQEAAKTSMSYSADAAFSRAGLDAAESLDNQQQEHAVKQQTLHSQSAELTLPSGEGQDEGNALQQRHAMAQQCGIGRDIAALMSNMQNLRREDVRDGKTFLDSVDCLDID